MAQPTNKKFKFTEDHAKTVILLGQQGASQKAMYAAIGISKSTALKLKKEDLVFAETLDLATTYGQAFWENLMLTNVENKAFNSRVAEISLRGQYPDDYKETREQKIDLKAEVVVDFGAEVTKLIESLKEAK
jgi:DNA-binding XRE family transcriptional regulator